MLETGAKAPEVHLRDLDGKVFDLREELRGAPVLLAIFKASCPTCQLTLPFLQRLHSLSPEQPGNASTPTPRTFLISQDDAATTRKFHAHFGISLPTLLDTEAGGYPVSSAFGITNVPSMFLVEPDGVISWTLDCFHRREMEALASRFGVALFRSEERVPELQPG